MDGNDTRTEQIRELNDNFRQAAGTGMPGHYMMTSGVAALPISFYISRDSRALLAASAMTNTGSVQSDGSIRTLL